MPPLRIELSSPGLQPGALTTVLRRQTAGVEGLEPSRRSVLETNPLTLSHPRNRKTAPPTRRIGFLSLPGRYLAVADPFSVVLDTAPHRVCGVTGAVAGAERLELSRVGFGDRLPTPGGRPCKNWRRGVESNHLLLVSLTRVVPQREPSEQAGCFTHRFY